MIVGENAQLALDEHVKAAACAPFALDLLNFILHLPFIVNIIHISYTLIFDIP
jgi:hypothetical protein